MEPSQYTSIRYTDRLANAGLAASIGTIGDSYDNAMAEALNGTFKTELIKLHGIKTASNPGWLTQQRKQLH